MSKFMTIVAYLLVTLVIIMAVVPFLIPISPAPDTMPLDQLVNPGSQYIDANGVKIYYTQSGVDEPVFILLHGFGASTYSWHAVYDDFSRQGSVIAYDRPAFGFTQRPLPGEWGDINPYSFESQIEHLWALMDTLGVQKAILVGHSAGGAIAIKAALSHPERVEALILVDAAVYQNSILPPQIWKLLRIPQIDRLGPLFARMISKQADKFLQRAWHDPALITDEIKINYLLPFKAKNWDIALWELVKARSNPDIRSRLEELSMPVLVITGEDDHVIPIWESQRLAKAIPNAELAVIKNCGHIPQEECSEDFLSAVDAFLVE